MHCDALPRLRRVSAGLTFSIVSFAAVLVGVASLASPALAVEVEVKEAIVYAKRGDTELALDLARPAGDTSERRPAILCIHGGGWRGGARDAYRGLIRALAEEGYVAATVSYRLTTIAPWPAQLEDVRDALRFLKRHASDYGIDPERIGAVGHSAGGHLSLVLGLRDEGAASAADGVAAVVNFFGPTDLRIDEFRPEVSPLIDHLVGGPRAEHAKALEDASPIAFIDRGDAAILTFHGDADVVVPVNQARILQEALEKTGVPSRLVVLEGQGHGWGGAIGERTTRESLAFFDTWLRGSKHPLLVAEDFDAGFENWRPTDPAQWKHGKKDGQTFLSLATKRGSYRPEVRSPENIAILEGTEVGDFTLDVRARSTHEPYGHQDVCLVFGYRDPSHFYYVHLAPAADDAAHSIFIVDGAPRKSIAAERTEGVKWSKGWHRIRVRRETESGRIEVYFDDLSKPIMVATDKTFASGKIGVGSFDDTADFDAIRLRGVRK
ncbi:MAG TPA: alpha/beta hydrolase [Planctomycetota bacterium]|nr:alpha/beta hydrolase [Planctomycetota bacterium]